MRDSEKASIIALICFLPFIPFLIVYSFNRSLIVATLLNRYLFLLILANTAVLVYMLLKVNPRVGHYFNALAEFDRNYRYEEEAQ